MKISVYDVAGYLIKNSSADHKVSRKEIMSAMNLLNANMDDFKNLSIKENTVDEAVRMQVTRILEDYTDVPLFMDMTIRCTSNSVTTDNHGNPLTKPHYVNNTEDKVYYAESLLTEAQVNILRDSIAVYPYAEQDETGKIITALNKLTPVFNEYKYDPDVISGEKSDTSCYKNIIEITKALSTRKYDSPDKPEAITLEETKMTMDDYEKSRSKQIMKVSFRYTKRGPDKKLHYYNSPRNIIDENDPYLRKVNPAKLMWANGYYYLVTFSYDKNGIPYYINYRVDRMTNVECTNEPAERIPDEFSEKTYKYKHIAMFSEGPERRGQVVIRCANNIINNALDTFGLDVDIRKYDEDNVLIILSDTGWTGIRMWALEFYFGCEILEPPALREEIKSAAADMLKKYSDGKPEKKKSRSK